MTAHEQIELLIGATQFDVGLERHRVVALHQRVEEFVDADRVASVETLVKVVALHHARHGVAAGELDHAARAQLVTPLAVVANLGSGWVEHAAGLLVVGFGVGLDLFSCQRRARAVAAAGVANQAGEVANQEDHGMPQILQLPHLVQHHGMAQMNIGRGGIQPQLDAQRLAGILRTDELLDPIILRQQFLATAQRHGQRVLHGVAQGGGGVRRFGEDGHGRQAMKIR